jgi:hypothetical protein
LYLKEEEHSSALLKSGFCVVPSSTVHGVQTGKNISVKKSEKRYLEYLIYININTNISYQGCATLIQFGEVTLYSMFFFPKIHNPSLIMRQTSNKAQL